MNKSRRSFLKALPGIAAVLGLVGKVSGSVKDGPKSTVPCATCLCIKQDYPAVEVQCGDYIVTANDALTRSGTEIAAHARKVLPSRIHEYDETAQWAIDRINAMPAEWARIDWTKLGEHAQRNWRTVTIIHPDGRREELMVNGGSRC